MVARRSSGAGEGNRYGGKPNVSDEADEGAGTAQEAVLLEIRVFDAAPAGRQRAHHAGPQLQDGRSRGRARGVLRQ